MSVTGHSGAVHNGEKIEVELQTGFSSGIYTMHPESLWITNYSILYICHHQVNFIKQFTYTERCPENKNA